MTIRETCFILKFIPYFSDFHRNKVCNKPVIYRTYIFLETQQKSDFEDFTSPEENYLKFKKLKNDLVQVQKRLSKMDIIEWHEITGSLHPANHVMDKVGVI